VLQGSALCGRKGNNDAYLPWNREIKPMSELKTIQHEPGNCPCCNHNPWVLIAGFFGTTNHITFKAKLFFRYICIYIPLLGIQGILVFLIRFYVVLVSTPQSLDQSMVEVCTSILASRTQISDYYINVSTVYTYSRTSRFWFDSTKAHASCSFCEKCWDDPNLYNTHVSDLVWTRRLHLCCTHLCR